MTSELSPEDRELRRTVAWELTSAGNYPNHVAAQVIGTDMTPIIDAVFAALQTAGYTKPIVPKSQYPNAYMPALGNMDISAAPMNIMPDPGVMISLGDDKKSEVVWSSFDTDEIKSLISDIAAAAGIRISIG